MKATALVLVVGLLGCGGGGGGGSVSLSAFPQRAATAVCSQNFKCCDPAELAGKTMTDCVQTNEFFLLVTSSEISSSQSMGRATYHADKMGTCISSFSALTCDDWKAGNANGLMGSGACLEVTTPAVALGGACQQDFECTSGSCVGADTSQTPPVDGTCVAADPAPAEIAVGGACTAGSDTCVSNAYCDPVSGTCQTRKAAGEACGSSDECANECDLGTGTCTCYVGCSAAGPVTPGRTLLALGLVALALLGARRGRRRRSLGERARTGG